MNNTNKTRILLPIGFVAILAFIVTVEVISLDVSFDVSSLGLIVWNCLPVIISYAVLTMALRKKGPFLAAAIAFSVLAVALQTFVHIDWQFGDTASSSSTSALVFMFGPVMAYVVGSIAALFTYVIARIATR